jgi:hypothetical protein
MTYLVMDMNDASRSIQHKSCWLHAILGNHDLNAARVMAVVTGEHLDEPSFLGGSDGKFLSAESGGFGEGRDILSGDTRTISTRLLVVIKLLVIQFTRSDSFPEVDWL